MKREEEGSTGVGEEIAIPHGKGESISEPGLAAMVIPEGVDFDSLDGKPIKPMIKGFFTYPLFMGSWILINIKCLFKRDTKWEKINHVRSIKIDEVDENVKEVEKV